uniref:Uncharacterized protein n=1 Tax=Alexandrium andersonii TaxID=327968 RepID=A0A7S2AYR9_9DINO|mmetsp:Transcript_20070/g.45595  ORF Transcript_20070/g.45595 Transcript_20070/m.45595 type:complete len:304 (+) Transcript_20070:116-1027(+)
MAQGFMTTARAEEVLQSERQAMREQVRHEFFDRKNPNELIERELHNDNPEVSHVYGGAMSALPQEGQIVQAWRPTPWGEWQLGKGIIHRVHQEDKTVTVQFVPDQHRVRTGFMNVKPLFDYTPEYPEIRLAPSERLPTRAEILEREQKANAMRQDLGIPADAPLPGADNLRAGETRLADGSVVMKSDHWGIPAPTLDALRNRSIPPGQITGEYGRHFYTNLYRNNFYLGKEAVVDADGRVGVEARHGRPEEKGRVISHRFIPLDGPQLEQDLQTGQWYPVATKVEPVQREPETFLERMVWFLG